MDNRTIVSRATELFRLLVPWDEFFREILGVDGLVSQLTPEARRAFEFSDDFATIHAMLYQLRQRASENGQPQRVITVRLPSSLHESLRHEAHDKHTSMNKLCISKLLQPITDDLVPTDSPSYQPTRRPQVQDTA